MALNPAKIETDDPMSRSAINGLGLLDCSICGQRFSEVMEWAWPLCVFGKDHSFMSSTEQIRAWKESKPPKG